MNPKIKKINTEYQKNAAKIAELEARQAELTKQRTELENLDIIGLVRGVGLDPDVLREVFKSYPPMFDGNHPIHAHNNYVQMWAELGLFGGLSYLAALLAQVKSGLKAYWRTTDRRVKDLLGAALGGFCGILLVGLVEYTWFYPRNMFIYWFLFGVIAACVKLAGESGETA